MVALKRQSVSSYCTFESNTVCDRKSKSHAKDVGLVEKEKVAERISIKVYPYR